MGEPAVFSSQQLRELANACRLVRESVADDEPNPVADAALARARTMQLDGEIEHAQWDQSERAFSLLDNEHATLAIAFVQVFDAAEASAKEYASLLARNVELELLARRPENVGPPVRLEVNRRMPAALEVLPPEQRARWAREKTIYDK